MMHLYCRGKLALALALFTQRVGCKVTVTDSFPRSAILTTHIRTAFIFVVTFAFLFFMLLAEPTVSKLGAVRMGTRFLWTSWHDFTSILGIRKALAGGCSYKGLVRFYPFHFYAFRYYNNIIRGYCITMDVTVMMLAIQYLPTLFCVT